MNVINNCSTFTEMRDKNFLGEVDALGIPDMISNTKYLCIFIIIFKFVSWQFSFLHFFYSIKNDRCSKKISFGDCHEHTNEPLDNFCSVVS